MFSPPVMQQTQKATGILVPLMCSWPAMGSFECRGTWIVSMMNSPVQFLYKSHAMFKLVIEELWL
jgi:hypothetical protein